MQYNVGDHVRCIWGAKSVEYEAKIVVVNRASKEYFVHYQGWNKRYDEWISEKSVLGLWRKPSATVVGAPKIRHSKREKKTRRPVDWSPTPTSSRVTEKVVSVKVDCKPSGRASKPKRSPTVRLVKRPRHFPVPKFVDESAEESISSDDEDGGAGFPRSYIDTLAKQKKREERKRYRPSSPKQAGDFFKSSWKSSQPRNVASKIPLITHIPSAADTTNNLTAVGSSTLVECLDFSYIEADHNYSSLRFHYNDAQSFNVRNDSNSAQVTSSTKRMNILPLRKPLNVQCKLACCAPLNLFMKASSVNLEPHQKIDTPPNFGSPFNYDDECRHPSLRQMEYKNGLGVPNLVNQHDSDFSPVNQHASDFSPTSSSSSESGDWSSDLSSKSGISVHHNFIVL